MDRNNAIITRRAILGGMAASAVLLPFGSAANAQLGGLLGEGSGGGLGLGSILGKASDGALNKLAQPGAYFNDEDIRLGLPIVGGLGGGSKSGGLLGSVLGAVSKTGILDGVTRKINDAAGLAAGEAKPIFRDAINGLSFNDVPGLVKQSDGGTQYLRTSSNDALHGKMTPLVDTALGDLGVYNQFDKIAAKHSWVRAAGLNREGINKSVTDQGLDGIFSYMGTEEKAFRKNPLGGAGDAAKILKGIF
ncbi:MAG: DUF4197 domain-containing protein [Erythrobacter sp.]